MRHELKIMPEFYEAVAWSNKSFEIRKDDRGYKCGDTLLLREWDGEEYTDKPPLERRIRYILRNCPKYGLMEGYCILSF